MGPPSSVKMYQTQPICTMMVRRIQPARNIAPANRMSCGRNAIVLPLSQVAGAKPSALLPCCQHARPEFGGASGNRNCGNPYVQACPAACADAGGDPLGGPAGLTDPESVNLHRPNGYESVGQVSRQYWCLERPDRFVYRRTRPIAPIRRGDQLPGPGRRRQARFLSLPGNGVYFAQHT